MALPTQQELISLDFIVDGQPFVRVTGTSTINADGLHYIVDGEPWYATSPSGAPPVTYNAAQFFMLF